MTHYDATTRRDVLRGSAVGVGALVGGSGAVALAQDSSAAAPAFAAAATGAQHFWLSVTGVSGPSTARGFEGQIPVTSFAVGVDAVSGAGGGKITPSTFDFTATTSKATPQLLAALVTGANVTKAILTGVRVTSSGASQRYLKITLSNVVVTSLHTIESRDGAPVDHVSLTYNRATVAIDGQAATFPPNNP